MAAAPACIPATTSLLTARAVVKLTADQMEKRPPTQSQSLKICAAGTPHARAASGLAVMATTCPKGSATQAALSHSSARRALSNVSAVVNDLEATTIRVSCGSSQANTLAIACKSLFATIHMMIHQLV